MRSGSSEQSSFVWPTPKFRVGQIVRYAVPAAHGCMDGVRVKITTRIIKEYMDGSTRVFYEADWIGEGGSPEQMTVSEELVEEAE